MFDNFLGASAPSGADGYEFEIYGQLPDADAVLELVPFGGIYPSEHNDIRADEDGSLDPRAGGQTPIGTGPYQVVEDTVAEGDGLTLERYDDYWVEDLGLDTFDWWDGPEDFPAGPQVQEIEIVPIPEEGTRVAALQEGEVDLIYQIGAQNRQGFESSNSAQVVDNPATGFLYQQFPINTDVDSAWTIPEVREAYNLLIPRQAIVDIVSQGAGAPAQLPFPEAASGQVSPDKNYDELKQEDWAYPTEPQPDQAAELLNQADVETPVSIEVHTNSDDNVRQDKMSIIVDELNNTDLFEAELVTPASLGDWTAQTLYVDGSRDDYAADNALACIGLAAGTTVHPYFQALHAPSNHNGCCNFFHPAGTFDWIEDGTLNEARNSLEAVQSLEFRQEQYEIIAEAVSRDLGNTFVDFDLTTAIVGSDVEGYIGWNDRRQFATKGVWNPLSDDFATLNR